MAVHVVTGSKFIGVDYATAPGTDPGHVIGYTPLLDILKVDAAIAPALLLQLKYYHHSANDPRGADREESKEKEFALTMLVGTGRWRQKVWAAHSGESVEVILQESGDFIAWGPGLRHSWFPEEPSTMLTVRWRKTSV